MVAHRNTMLVLLGEIQAHPDGTVLWLMAAMGEVQAIIVTVYMPVAAVAVVATDAVAVVATDKVAVVCMQVAEGMAVSVPVAAVAVMLVVAVHIMAKAAKVETALSSSNGRKG